VTTDVIAYEIHYTRFGRNRKKFTVTTAGLRFIRRPTSGLGINMYVNGVTASVRTHSGRCLLDVFRLCEATVQSIPDKILRGGSKQEVVFRSGYPCVPVRVHKHLVAPQRIARLVLLWFLSY